MNARHPIELFTLKALAREENISYSYLKKLMMEVSKRDPMEWRGWRFVPVGTELKRFWLAYKGQSTVVVHDSNRAKNIPNTTAYAIAGKYQHTRASSEQYLKEKWADLDKENL